MAEPQREVGTRADPGAKAKNDNNSAKASIILVAGVGRQSNIMLQQCYVCILYYAVINAPSINHI